MEQQNYNLIERLLTEAAGLFDRLSRLSNYILISEKVKKLDRIDRQYLKRQHWCMTEYLKVLNDRIAKLVETQQYPEECLTEQESSSHSISE